MHHAAPSDCPTTHRPAHRFRFRAAGGEVSRCTRHAIVHPPVLRTALLTALVVGTILTVINQGNVLVAGHFPPVLYWKIPLTYSVPFGVSTFAALRISLVRE